MRVKTGPLTFKPSEPPRSLPAHADPRSKVAVYTGTGGDYRAKFRRRCLAAQMPLLRINICESPNAISFLEGIRSRYSRRMRFTFTLIVFLISTAPVRTQNALPEDPQPTLLTPPEVIAAVHDNTPVPDAKLNALVSLVRELVRERGYTKAKTIQKFLAAGYTKEQVMEILLGIALKTISNYLDHISPTPLDP